MRKVNYCGHLVQMNAIKINQFEQGGILKYEIEKKNYYLAATEICRWIISRAIWLIKRQVIWDHAFWLRTQHWNSIFDFILSEKQASLLILLPYVLVASII